MKTKAFPNRLLDTEERRQFWASFDQNAAEVEKWPYWKRGGSAAEERDRRLRDNEKRGSGDKHDAAT